MAEKRKPVPPPSRERLDTLRTVCVISVTNREDVPVYFDENIHTAMTDLKSIYITYNSIPENLRVYDEVVLIALKGQTLHEAGHILLTIPLDEEYKKWAARFNKSELTQLVRNLVEDSRINHKLGRMYRYGVGAELSDWHEVLGASWASTERKETAKAIMEWTAANKGPWPGAPLNTGSGQLHKEIINRFIALKGLYHMDKLVDEIINDYFSKMPQEMRDDMEAGADIIRRVRTHMVWLQNIKGHATNLWRIMQKYAPDGTEGAGQGPGGDGDGGGGGTPGGGTPIDFTPSTDDKPEGRSVKGGGFDPKLWPAPYGRKKLDAPDDIVDGIEDKEKQKEKKQKAPKGPGGGQGPGSGDEIPYPNPDEIAYRNRRDKLASIIQRMRNMLKFESRPKYEVNKYRPHGRMMQGVMAGAFLQARKGRQVTDIYSMNTVRYEKTESTLALVVDMSGSTDPNRMANVLTIIAEVAGMWLPDENWAIIAFGSEYQKIKTFFEQYETTKFRIGGLTDLGGTELASPLAKIREMFKALKHKPGKKIVIIVSDFAVDVKSSAHQIKLLKSEVNADTVLIATPGRGGTVEDAVANAHEVSDENVVPMPDLESLPEEFFKVYKKLSYEDKPFGGM